MKGKEETTDRNSLFQGVLIGASVLAGLRGCNLTMCSFCGKSHAEVKKLIAGPGVYICDGCIHVCEGILEKELHEEKEVAPTDLTVPKPKELLGKLTGIRFFKEFLSVRRS